MTAIAQTHLPHTPWDDPALSRMPGMKPVEGAWLVVDEAYAEQMAERARLMSERPEAVAAVLPGADAALEEVRETVLDALPDGFRRDADRVTCPDGRVVEATGAPFGVLAALVQEDLLLLERRGGEHVLIAGLLCFPSHWTLAEKIGRPLGRIHRPVARYDGKVAMRVQRLFDRARAGRPMWRANAMPAMDAELHHPRAEAAPPRSTAGARYVRSERQTVLRLPRTDTVLFAIHTWIVALEDLTPAQRLRCPLG